MTQPTTPNAQLAFLRGLRATRQFKADPVPQAILDDILEVARWTGSAMNSQPWHVIVVRDRAALDALANAGGYVKQLESAPVGLVLVMKSASDAFDEGRLAERIMLAASAHNLGTGLGWLNEAGRAAAKQLLGVPSDAYLVSVIALGYPTAESLKPRAKPGEARKPLTDIVRNERF